MNCFNVKKLRVKSKQNCYNAEKVLVASSGEQEFKWWFSFIHFKTVWQN